MTTKKKATKKKATRKRSAVAKKKTNKATESPIENIDENVRYQCQLSKALNFTDELTTAKRKSAIDNTVKKLFDRKITVDVSALSETIIKLCFLYGTEDYDLNDDHIKTLKERLTKAKKKREKKKEKQQEDVYASSIQDRIKNIAYQIATDFDIAIDEFTFDQKEDALDDIQPLKHLNMNECKGPQARYIRSFYDMAYDGLIKSKKKGDDYVDYREAYGYLSTKQKNKLIEFYENIFAACDAVEKKSKATRKKKTTKKTKKLSTIVKSVKYQKEDQDFMLVSINPEEIIGAKQLWVFNTKTRVFGCYQSLGEDGMTVKGTTLQDIALDSSEFKKVRNPPALFKLLKDKKTKRGYNNALKKLNTKPQKQSARINANTILLAAFK